MIYDNPSANDFLDKNDITPDYNEYPTEEVEYDPSENTEPAEKADPEEGETMVDTQNSDIIILDNKSEVVYFDTKDKEAYYQVKVKDTKYILQGTEEKEALEKVKQARADETKKENAIYAKYRVSLYKVPVFNDETGADEGNFHYYVKIRNTDNNSKAESEYINIKEVFNELIASGSYKLNGFLQDKLAFTANILIGKDTEEKSELSKYASYRHTCYGWKTVNGKDYFFGNDGVYLDKTKGLTINESVKRLNSRFLKNNVVNITTKGDFEGWKINVNEIIAVHPVPAIVMAASFAGIIRQRYKKLANETQLIINICGPSSRGKTTTIQCAYTAFTSIDQLMTYNSTINQAMERVASRSPIVASIDDILRMDELKIGGKSRAEQLLNIIFSADTGLSKQRRTSAEQKEFYNTLLMSSTESLFDNTSAKAGAGQHRRLIELTLDDCGAFEDDSDLNDKVLSALEDNCGWAAQLFAENLLKSEYSFGGFDEFEEYLVERYNDIKEKLSDPSDEESIKNSEMIRRPAMILFVADLLNEMLNLEFDIDAMKDYLVENANEAVKTKNEAVNKSKNALNLNSAIVDPNKAYKKVVDFFKGHGKLFFDQNNINNKPSKVDLETKFIGSYEDNYVDINGNKCYLINIPAYKEEKWRLPTILELKDEEDIFKVEHSEIKVDKIVRQWKKDELLECKKSATTRKVTFVTGEGQKDSYSIIVLKALISNTVAAQVGTSTSAGTSASASAGTTASVGVSDNANASDNSDVVKEHQEETDG